MTSRKRRPTAAELALWQRITEDVTPLSMTGLAGIMEAPFRAADATGISPDSTGKNRNTDQFRRAGPPAPAPARPVPALPGMGDKKDRPGRGHLPGLDRKTSQKLQRGTLAIEARLDLHGLTQNLAHGRLASFIRAAHQMGYRCVLVITGKGEAKAVQAWYDRPGILREMVPHWLAAPELRPLVLAVTRAARHHGGEGACYVYLRRKR